MKEGEQKTTGSGTKPPSASIASGLQGCCLSKAFKHVVYILTLGGTSFCREL